MGGYGNCGGMQGMEGCRGMQGYVGDVAGGRDAGHAGVQEMEGTEGTQGVHGSQRMWVGAHVHGHTAPGAAEKPMPGFGQRGVCQASSSGALLTRPQRSPALPSPISALTPNGHGSNSKRSPKHHLLVTVGVCRNPLGTDSMLRRDPFAPGGHFLWDPLLTTSCATARPLCSLSHRYLLGHVPCPCSQSGEWWWQCRRWLKAVQGVCAAQCGWAPVERIWGEPLAWEV